MKSKGIIAIVLTLVLFVGILAYSIKHEPEGPKVTIKKSVADTRNLPGKAEIEHSRSKLIYLPIYSHIYAGEGTPIPMAITISIRNTSIKSPLNVHSMKYFDTTGTMVMNYIEKTLGLMAMGTKEFFIKESDLAGGSGANLIISIEYDRNGPKPIVEAVMAGGTGSRGFVFRTKGVNID